MGLYSLASQPGFLWGAARETIGFIPIAQELNFVELWHLRKPRN